MKGASMTLTTIPGHHTQRSYGLFFLRGAHHGLVTNRTRFPSAKRRVGHTMELRTKRPRFYGNVRRVTSTLVMLFTRFHCVIVTIFRHLCHHVLTHHEDARSHGLVSFRRLFWGRFQSTNVTRAPSNRYVYLKGSISRGHPLPRPQGLYSKGQVTFVNRLAMGFVQCRGRVFFFRSLYSHFRVFPFRSHANKIVQVKRGRSFHLFHSYVRGLLYHRARLIFHLRQSGSQLHAYGRNTQLVKGVKQL